ncbi:MAG TPA: lipoyl synthase, partial [Accumulibacter sp.]|nr:lipoyl synthase [Accumulibacter sp.]
MSSQDDGQAGQGTTRAGARIAGVKERGELKTARIPIKIVAQTPQRKPDWIRVKAGNDAGRFGEIKKMLREQKLHTVCEEAACP